jgi:hypothetical protein
MTNRSVWRVLAILIPLCGMTGVARTNRPSDKNVLAEERSAFAEQEAAANTTCTPTPQAPAGGETTRDVNVQRLELMKESVNTYELIRSGDRTRALKLQRDPAFRLGRQGNGGILEGAIFLWTDEFGRPEAAAQVFLHRYAGRPDGEWIHEFTSLSSQTFTANQNGVPQWRPSEPGVVLSPLPGAPKPAALQAQRLRQMRALAEEFKAEDNFGDGGWEVLRILPTPITRYGKPGGAPEDGALFAFVEGTDPEVFLFLEARPSNGSLQWQYALAPMTCWALKVERRGQGVWSLPRRATDDPSKTFFDRSYRP